MNNIVTYRGKFLKAVHALLGLVAAMALGGCASTVGSGGGLQIKEVGSFHIGGKQVVLSGLPEKELRFTPSSPPIKVNPNGEFEAEQMYVQYVLQSAPKAKQPLLLWHGGGLAGVTFETKPDGGEGWQMAFLKAGYDVYTSDAVERGRASWARYPEIFTSEPFFRTKKEGWELFRALDASKVDIAGLKAVPHLFVWGDNLDKNATWQTILPPVRRFADAVKALGGVVDTIDLPAQGLKGNSHMVMMDKNSDQVAALIQAWMAKQGLMR
jgi:hypothetical protein